MALATGKLPAAFLRELLKYCGAPDRRVLLGPGIGRDAAVIDLGDRCLVLKSDPVTFTAEEIGWYAVNVNANDVAVMGCRPAWFQATIIVPPRIGRSGLRQIVADIHRSATALGISVTGGHTEVSPAVNRPIVAGDMQGILARDDVVSSAGARPGDVIVLSKAAGIEGTAILARTFRSRAQRVLGKVRQRKAASFHHRPGISVVREALAAARCGVNAMHDPTEGGVAAGLAELAIASTVQLDVNLDQILVLPETDLLCEHFGLRPLGLIGSGALLATVSAANLPVLLRVWQRLGIPNAVIGTVRRGRGVKAYRDGKRARFEWSQRDELAKVLT